MSSVVVVVVVSFWSVWSSVSCFLDSDVCFVIVCVVPPSLIFTTGHDGIKAFFHDEANFSWEALLLYGCLYFWFAVVTYGIAVPSGLFVPCILTGSAFGRLMGNFVQWLFPHITINKGSYALIGAVAMLGGILRMTVRYVWRHGLCCRCCCCCCSCCCCVLLCVVVCCCSPICRLLGSVLRQSLHDCD